jgi:hypothetical protein
MNEFAKKDKDQVNERLKIVPIFSAVLTLRSLEIGFVVDSCVGLCSDDADGFGEREDIDVDDGVGELDRGGPLIGETVPLC